MDEQNTDVQIQQSAETQEQTDEVFSIDDLSTKPNNTAVKKRRRFSGVDAIEIAFMVILAALLFFSYVFSVAQIEGSSMENTLHDADRVIVRKAFYRPEDYDIVIVNVHRANILNNDGSVLQTNTTLQENIVKRVMATEGQTIDIDFETGVVYVDGKTADSDFTKEPTYTDLGAFSYPLTVPKGYIFVMGDNRNNSTDSRSPYVGLVNVDDVVGKVVYRFYPYSDAGSLVYSK